MSEEKKVLVGCQGEGLLVVIHGLGSMNNSACIYNYVRVAMEHDVCEVCFDFTHLVSMDSTFMGTLLLLYEKVSAAGGEFFLVNVSKSNQSKLDELGIANFLKVDQQLKIPELELIELDTSGDSDRERMRHILESHEKLISKNESNQLRFGKFVAMLKKELGEQSSC